MAGKGKKYIYTGACEEREERKMGAEGGKAHSRLEGKRSVKNTSWHVKHCRSKINNKKKKNVECRKERVGRGRRKEETAVRKSDNEEKSYHKDLKVKDEEEREKRERGRLRGGGRKEKEKEGEEEKESREQIKIEEERDENKR